jgi:hypothetical protein
MPADASRCARPAPAPGTPAPPTTRRPVAPTPVTSAIATVELLDGVATTGYARTDGNPSLTLT